MDIILYQIFDDCKYLTFDNELQNTFQQAACGKFPKRLVFKNMELTCSLTGKSVNVAGKNSTDVFIDLVNLFQHNAVTDNNVSNVVNEPVVEWKKIKKELKERLVSDFIVRQSLIHGLNTFQIRYLECVVNMLIQFHIIRNEDIIMCQETGVIERIEGVYVDEVTKNVIHPEIYGIHEDQRSVGGKNVSGVVGNVDKFLKLFVHNVTAFKL